MNADSLIRGALKPNPQQDRSRLPAGFAGFRAKIFVPFLCNALIRHAFVLRRLWRFLLRATKFGIVRDRNDSPTVPDNPREAYLPLFFPLPLPPLLFSLMCRSTYAGANIQTGSAMAGPEIQNRFLPDFALINLINQGGNF